MTVSSTSMLAYGAVKPKVGRKQQQVYDAIEELGIASNGDLASFLAWPINTITPRVKELRMLGLVGFEDYKVNEHGMKVKGWSVRNNEDDMLTRLIKECGA